MRGVRAMVDLPSPSARRRKKSSGPVGRWFRKIFPKKKHRIRIEFPAGFDSEDVHFLLMGASSLEADVDSFSHVPTKSMSIIRFSTGDLSHVYADGVCWIKFADAGPFKKGEQVLIPKLRILGVTVKGNGIPFCRLVRKKLFF
jgi:hypothetical protein